MWAGVGKSPSYRWVGCVSSTTWLSLVTPWAGCQVSVRLIREMGYSVRGTDLASGSLAHWVFSWWRCPREAWCVHTAPKAGAAGSSSSSSLLWILSKPQDCSKALGCLGYSLRTGHKPHGRAVTCTWQSPLLPSFGWNLSCCLSHLDCVFPFVALIQVFIWPAVVSLSGRNNCFVHLCSPFSSLNPAYFCWAHSLPLDDINWITDLIALCEYWWGVLSCRLVSLKLWSRILHQHPSLCLEAVTEHKLLFKELAHLLHLFEFWDSSTEFALLRRLSTNRIWLFSVWKFSTNSTLYVLDLLTSWGCKMLLRRDFPCICLCLTVAAEGMLLINLVSLRIFLKCGQEMYPQGKGSENTGA